MYGLIDQEDLGTAEPQLKREGIHHKKHKIEKRAQSKREEVPSVSFSPFVFFVVNPHFIHPILCSL
jgi:hypothetical protein